MSPVARLTAAVSLAVALSPAPVQAQATEGQMFGVWKYTCADGACRTFLNLQRDGAEVVSWTLLRDRGNGQSTSLIRVPEGVALPPGLRIYADDTTFFDIPYQVCDGTGCSAIAVMDEAMQKALEGKKTVRVAFIPYGQPEPVAYEVPVEGFRAALDAL